MKSPARRLLATALLVGLLASGIGWLSLWNKKRILTASGGLPMGLVLQVPHFCQGDPLWGNDSLADTEATLAQEGCAVTSAAMVLASYGADTDPGHLNALLQQNGGYTEQGWIYWEKAAEAATGVRHAYEDLPSYRLIDLELLRGNPVIVRVRLPSGMTHFVVIAGKSGLQYLIHDPASEGGMGLLSNLNAPVEALRFYRPAAL